MHPRNRHLGGLEFKRLSQKSPGLAPFVMLNEWGNESIDFANPAAVKALNKALLKQFYGVALWDLPPGYLCPSVPGRADYLHSLADLLASSNQGVIPRGAQVRALDIGVGANCVYPLIGTSEYGWRFLGSEVDPVALASATQESAFVLMQTSMGSVGPDILYNIAYEIPAGQYPSATEKAKKALEGPEGDELRKAEEKGKAGEPATDDKSGMSKPASK